MLTLLHSSVQTHIQKILRTTFADFFIAGNPVRPELGQILISSEFKDPLQFRWSSPTSVSMPAA